jgi:hypothetical protein
MKHRNIATGDDRYGGLVRVMRRDAWAEGIVDWLERFLNSLGLERAIWLIVGFAAGYFGCVIKIIMTRSS